MEPANKVRTTVYLTIALRDKLFELAKRKRLSASQLIDELVEDKARAEGVMEAPPAYGNPKRIKPGRRRM